MISGMDAQPNVPPNTVFSIPALLAECARLRDEGRAEDALCLLDRAEQSREEQADANAAANRIPFLLARADALNALGRVDEAIEVCRMARNADGGSCEAHFGLCFTLYLAERRDEALAELDALIAAAPAHPNAAWLRAGVLRRVYGDLDACVLDAYALACAVEPRNAYAQVERADVLRAMGRYEEARDIYARFQSPDACGEEALRVEAAFKRGCVALALNDNAEARAAFQAVLDVAPDYPDAAEMLLFAGP